MVDGAVLFDIDGTLVDSNYLHVEAWGRAFTDVGHPQSAWRVHRCIGMEGGKLLDSLLGSQVEVVGNRAKDLHSKYYQELTPRLQPLPGARELLRRVRSLGLQVVLATSAPEDELAHLRELLDVEDLVSAVTSSASVFDAKPEPDIIEVALQRANVPADRAVMVGDAVWDVKAAKKAAVPCIGLLSGGISRGELADAGAAAVFDDARDLLDHIEDCPIEELMKR